MAHVIISGNFEKARRELKQCGIILTTRRHKKGGFVCYANKELREWLARWNAQIERSEDDQ